MKKLFTTVVCTVAVALGVLVGCKTVPSPESVGALSYSIGVSAGIVVNMEKLDASVTDNVLEALALAKAVVPAEGKTFEETWTVVVNEVCDKLIADGKIDAMQAGIIKAAMLTVERGVDFMFAKHPEWREKEVLVSAAVNGFVDGFTTVVKPSNTVDIVSAPKPDLDALAYLKAERAARK